MVKKLALACFFLLICFKVFAVGDDPEFRYKKSTYKLLWGKEPYIPDNDKLAFSVIKIYTEKVSFKEEKSLNTDFREREYFSEVSTGFLAWSTYELKKATDIYKYCYRYLESNNIKEPLLITCNHCIKEWKDTEEIEALEFDIHYVDPQKKQFYLVTVRLPNKNHKIPWVSGERDIAALPLGAILQKGKEKLDNELKSDHYPLFKAINPKDMESVEETHDVGYLVKFTEVERNLGYLSDVVMYMDILMNFLPPIACL